MRTIPAVMPVSESGAQPAGGQLLLNDGHLVRRGPPAEELGGRLAAGGVSEPPLSEQHTAGTTYVS